MGLNVTAPLDDLPAPEDTPFKIEAVEDLLTLPDPDWLVNGVIQRNTLGLIYGPSGCGKSFLALDLAHHLALQRPWFGHEVDQRAGVLYVAAEASGGIVKRVKAFRQHHQLAENTCSSLWFIRSPVDLLAPKTVDDMEITWAAWANNFEVIVFDTLSRCLPGGAENQPEVMTTAVDTLDRIRDRLDATIIVVHHSPLSDRDRPRGHSSLYAAADTAITIDHIGDIRTATLKYQRDGEEGARFAFKLKQLEIGQDKHLRPITSCVVEEAVTPTSESRQEKLNANQATYLRLLQD